MLNLMAWLELHRKQLIAGFAAVVALIAVVYLYRHFRDEAEARANAALLELRALPGQPESAPKAADYLKVAEAHASTSAGPRARLLAAGAFFADNRYAEAQSEFEKVRTSVGSGPLAAQAAFGIAACLDALDKTEPAAAAYREVISSYPEDSVAGQARLALARIETDRKQPAAALRLYDELLRDRESGPFSQQARQLREELVRKNPTLAGGASAPAAAAK